MPYLGCISFESDFITNTAVLYEQDISCQTFVSYFINTFLFHIICVRGSARMKTGVNFFIWFTAILPSTFNNSPLRMNVL